MSPSGSVAARLHDPPGRTSAGRRTWSRPLDHVGSRDRFVGQFVSVLADEAARRAAVFTATDFGRFERDLLAESARGEHTAEPESPLAIVDETAIVLVMFGPCRTFRDVVQELLRPTLLVGWIDVCDAFDSMCLPHGLRQPSRAVLFNLYASLWEIIWTLRSTSRSLACLDPLSSVQPGNSPRQPCQVAGMPPTRCSILRSVYG